MNIYLLTQNYTVGYDIYDSCVVVANSAEEAILITPDGEIFDNMYQNWASSPEDVNCTLIGKLLDSHYKPGDVILSSFNAG